MLIFALTLALQAAPLPYPSPAQAAAMADRASAPAATVTISAEEYERLQRAEAEAAANRAAEAADVAVSADDLGELIRRQEQACVILTVWADSQPLLRDAAASDLGSAEQYLRMAQTMPVPQGSDARTWREATLLLAASIRDARRSQLESDQFVAETLTPSIEQLCR